MGGAGVAQAPVTASSEALLDFQPDKNEIDGRLFENIVVDRDVLE